MKKTDYDRLQYVGARLLTFNNVLATGETSSHDDEDYRHWDIWLSASTEGVVPVEVKTLRFRFNDLKNTNRFPWRGLPESVTPDIPVSILNAENNDAGHSRGKYYELVEAGGALVFLMKDCILWFSPEVLKTANLGTAELYCSLTKERGATALLKSGVNTDKKKTWQKKVIIDLSKGYKINVTPPKELFN